MKIFLQQPGIVAHRMTPRLTTLENGTPPGSGTSVHLTETCEDGHPHVITHVATTPAPMADDTQTLDIHEELRQANLLSQQHFVDAGYITAQTIVMAKERTGIELIGPTRANYRWQASQSQGFDAGHFVVDWETQQATCPQGHTSKSWTPSYDSSRHEVIKIKFSLTDCSACPKHPLCTKSSPPRRTLTLRPKDQYLALRDAARGASKSALSFTLLDTTGS